MHDFDGALTEYKTALKLEPRNTRAWTGLGHALKARNDLDGAIAAYKRSIDIYWRDAAPYESLGLALAAKNDWAGAIAAFRKSLEIAPYCRYELAMTTAYAGCEQKTETDDLREEWRVKLRMYSLALMREELDAAVRVGESGALEVQDKSREQLELWQKGEDLADVRDPDRLKRLPADEQDAWRCFWSEVEAAVEQPAAHP